MNLKHILSKIGCCAFWSVDC